MREWTEPTWTATIYVGFTNESPARAGLVVKTFCEEEKLCVTLSETRFIYPGGEERGIAIGLLNYPRFPREVSDLQQKALKLAETLRLVCSQKRVSVVFPDETITFGEDQ